MQKIEITAFDLASRFIGLKEVAGPVSNPAILAMLQLDAKWPPDDETAWCSAFVNYICWLLRLPRSKSLAARSWLGVGRDIPLAQAEPGFDIVVLSRGGGTQPDATVIDAPGHVGFVAGFNVTFGWIEVLAGNQGDAVSVARFPLTRLLSVRRLLG
jgi:uncharacterized protein (TIGR02594 family)